MPLQPILGLSIFILFAWLISEQRRCFPVRLVIIGLAAGGALARSPCGGGVVRHQDRDQ